MTAFIKQEAKEKAHEIEIKANEEFEIEKSKLVRQETDAIDTQYEKKFKQATMSQQITRSTVSNKTRLKVLAARQELLDTIFEEAQKKLADGVKDKAKYQKTLKGLILEGFYALNEPELKVRARKKDYDTIKKAITEAEQEYKKEVGTDIKGSIDEENPVPEGSYVAPNAGKEVDINADNYRIELAASSLLAETERSRSITPSRPGWNSSRSTLRPRCGRPSSERTPTASSSTKPHIYLHLRIFTHDWRRSCCKLFRVIGYRIVWSRLSSLEAVS